ncbi:MAG: long-chain fatty acid--CoA ligase [Bacteroidetes bacterium]|nr:long-chain fatty acid--CoA ligase [Bacteroidota bacterium]
MNQTDWTGRWNLYEPDAPAIHDADEGIRLSFKDLHQKGSTLAAILSRDYGLKQGDRIAILSENSLEHLFLFAAAQKAGFILVPFNYRLAASELDYLLTDCRPELFLYESGFALKDASGISKIDALKEARHVPHQEALKKLRARMEDSAPEEFEARQLEADDPIFILYTSGTTGFPKGAIYTHGMLFWNSINTSISLNLGTQSRTVNVMPFFHTGGWNVLTTPFLHLGGCSTMLKRFDAGRVLELLERERASIFMAVPTMLQMIADDPYFESVDLTGLDYIIVGGEPMPIPLIERWQEKGIAIRQGYGMTEVGPNLTSLHQRDALRKKGSIGRPNFYVQHKIVDEEGRVVGTNETGELLLKGPMVTPGYWRNPEASAKAIKDGWFHTGDLVREDEEAYLYVVDRIKNMFISGGENVFPVQVERILLQLPEIAEAAVVGVPNEKWGEVGKAFIVLKKEAELSIESIQAHCRTHLAGFKVPRHYSFLSELPKNDTGKLDRKQLKKESLQ